MEGVTSVVPSQGSTMISRPSGLEVIVVIIGGLSSLFLSWVPGQARKGAAQLWTLNARGVAGLRRSLDNWCKTRMSTKDVPMSVKLDYDDSK